MDGLKKLLAFEWLVKADRRTRDERLEPRDLVYGGRLVGQALPLHDDPYVRMQIDQLRDAYGYRKIEGKSPADDEEQRSSDEERTFLALCQVLRTGKDRAQAAWFHRDVEVQYYGPQLHNICSRQPRTLEAARKDIGELREVAHVMEGDNNENVRSFGRQMVEITSGLPGIESVGTTGRAEQG